MPTELKQKMKKHIFTLIAILSIFSACKKDNNDNPVTTTGDYQPLTAGSTWTYRNEAVVTGGVAAPEVTTAVTTMTSTKKVVGGKTYFLAKTVEGNDTEEAYIGVNDHIYSSLVSGDDGNTEVKYLDDTKAAGYTSVEALNIEGADARLKTTVVEKGINKTIQNKAYNNVSIPNWKHKLKTALTTKRLAQLTFTWLKASA